MNLEKWYKFIEYRPKWGTSIFLWNMKTQKKEMFNVFWHEDNWDYKTLPHGYASVWCYVLSDIDPEPIDGKDTNIDQKKD